MENWKEHLIAQERSGKSISEYCRQNGIAPKRLYYWRRREARESKFVEVGTPSPVSYELVLRDGLRLAIPERFNPASVKELLRVLGC